MITVIIVDMVVKLIVKHMKGSMEYMSEKRFYTDGQYVMQDREVYVICNGEHNADVVATALNELLDEIEQLKKENHGLKLRMSRVYYYFMDYLSDEMNSNSFSEMWDFVVESDVFGDSE